MQSSMGILLHAGRELDIEVFDGEFAGDEAREKRVSCANKALILSSQMCNLREQWLGV
jgi:hypothetical protein